DAGGDDIADGEVSAQVAGGVAHVETAVGRRRVNRAADVFKRQVAVHPASDRVALDLARGDLAVPRRSFERRDAHDGDLAVVGVDRDGSVYAVDFDVAGNALDRFDSGIARKLDLEIDPAIIAASHRDR